MRLNGNLGRSIFAAAAAALLLGVGAAADAEAPRADLIWVTAQVADASDRAYQPLAIHLIDHAASSILLAMYYLKEGDNDRHPVSLLLNDLREAAQRGVRVEVYLNMKFPTEVVTTLDMPWVKRLRAAGVMITGFTQSRRWHGKLLIVDDRYILEGSANWSVEALKTNGESNSLIDSPVLARQKLNHVREWGLPLSGTRTATPATPPPLPETVSIPAVWLSRGGVLSRLVTRDDERGSDTWLLLIRQAAAEAEPEFPVDLELLSKELALPEAWSNFRQRNEILKVFNRLKTRTETLEFQLMGYGKDAWVRLIFPEGPRVTLPMALLTPHRLTRQSAAATYLALLDVALRAEGGAGIQDISLDALRERTGLTTKLLSRARRELETE